ncbi:polymer-forming cytoskeletal protein [Prosthecochloris sp.]|uniref:bactofilin family protein n=1 Tax=Prosthecochloris sp. TaxID=290513 RepID=UPI0025CD9417|nr:polymer-forming cytoskeletal protein [Prosthecochloris sp.]
MFSKKGKKRRSGSTGGLTLLMEGTSVQGELAADGDIRVDGNVSGQVTCRSTLIIGSEGVVEGEISAENMRVAGKFSGNAEISGELRLEATAAIDGDLRVTALDVEDGAKLNGRVFMKQDEGFKEQLLEREPEPQLSGLKSI